MKHLFFASLCVVVVGCSGTKSTTSNNVPATCPSTFTACGGSVVGTWDVAKICNVTAIVAQYVAGICPTAVIDAPNVTVTGSVTFNSDGSFSQSTTTTGPMSIDLQAACTLGQSCANVAILAGGSITGISNVTCTSDTNGGCNCNATANLTTPLSGTYTTSGDNITMTSTSETGTNSVETDGYCVDGNTLAINYTSLSTAGSVPTTTYLTN